MTSAEAREVAARLAALRDPATDPERIFVTYGGTETELVFDKGEELPDFCAWKITMEKPQVVRSIQEPFAGMVCNECAKCGKRDDEHNVTLIMEAATWRANPDYVDKFDQYELPDVVAASVNEQKKMLSSAATDDSKPFSGLLSAEIGPRGDGYDPSVKMTVADAKAYHSVQIAELKKLGVDLASALTLNYADEAVGIALAAQEAGVPLIIGCTLEKADGKLPDGTDLRDFVQAVDSAAAEYPLCYLINCVHPTHCRFDEYTQEPWFRRVRGVRGNASTKSHAELDEMTVLDRGDVDEFSDSMLGLRKTYRDHFTLFGGCCGTDIQHVSATLAKILQT